MSTLFIFTSPPLGEVARSAGEGERYKPLSRIV